MLNFANLDTLIGNLAARIDSLDAAKRIELDNAAAIDAEEHAEFVKACWRGRSEGILDDAAASAVAVSLGETFSPKNGGWADATTTATKVIVTKLVSELLAVRIARRQAAVA